MAYNYDDQIPEWKNEGSEPTSSAKETGFTPGYKPPADYFNWFWNKTLKWLNDLRGKLSSLHTKVESIQTDVDTLKNKEDSGQTGTMGAKEILEALKTVDGAGSGLDADTLDGKQASEFASAGHGHDGYATTDHTHSEYASVNHKHSEYATSDHTHTGYASSSHTHSVASTSANGFMSSEMVEKLSKLDPAYLITLAERNKLATVEENANNYVHPSTHPASMISGLEAYLSDLGYGKSATGSYVGDGTHSYGTDTHRGKQTTYLMDDSLSNCRMIELPYTPSVLILFDKANGSMNFALQGAYGYAWTTTGSKGEVFYLTGNQLRVLRKIKCTTENNGVLDGPNLAGYTYQWLIF